VAVGAKLIGITTERKMQKETYKFNAKYKDVDFERILEENPSADFIEVEWAKTKGRPYGGFVLVTDSGYERLRKAEMSTPRRYVNARINPDGLGWRYDPYGSGVIRIIDGIDEFKRVFAKLRERECRKYEIKVTAIK
jgi:hypothetical protein